MKARYVACAVTFFLIASNAWGQSAAPRISYSDKEYSGMLSCVGMTDIAWGTALQKLKGLSLADVQKYQNEHQNEAVKHLSLLIVDQVYKDSFTNAWEYAVSFFGECALNLANVPKDRSGLAGYCMQNAMIGMVAWESKNAGQPIENVYQSFARFNSPTPRSIIDRAYASSNRREEIGLNEWKSCMQPMLSTSVSTPPPPVKPIPPLGGLTDKEFAAMPPCVELGEAVWAIANQKLKGVRLEDLKNKYNSQPDTKSKATALKVVDRVYADKFVGAGFYATRYLDQCAQTQANVTPNRMGVANSCLDNAYIAATASSFKTSGASSDKAYEPFAEFEGTKAGSIVDRVYRTSDSGDAGVAEWKACVTSSPSWTTPPKGQEILLATTPTGYQIGAQSKTEKFAVKTLYPQGESPNHWTERLTFEAFPELADHTPTQFQKAIQGPSENCKNGKVISSSVGEEDGYAFSLWSETCDGSSAGQMEFRFNKAIQGRDNLYLITKVFRSQPTDTQTQQSRSYLSAVRACDSTRSDQPCPTTDAWRP